MRAFRGRSTPWDTQWEASKCEVWVALWFTQRTTRRAALALLGLLRIIAPGYYFR